ncbi:YihY/virulence factor BrkB family protein [Nocardiopsis sp. N85]|uniref:YihY/virulence factor BrkB family protein n=1 Tax=Nocardiopsis sp. N85 TaxID=3029400 RepID=UPI00237FAD06|nr:YihY/virulence factor BrkB family protein [Nocardiopsis sp. N85]MDE3725285.1 YihY/virulence factor BrkB family protein [Nocardiopsis sp. N85]
MRTQDAHDRTRDAPGNAAARPPRIPTAGRYAVAARVWLELKEGHVGLLAAAMAFKALLALFPALLAAVSVFGILADPDELTDQIRDWMTVVPDEVGVLIGDQLTAIAETETGALGFTFATSLLVALWSASGGMAGMMEGCNTAYDEVDDRSFVVKRGIALLLALGVGTFAFVVVGLITVLPTLLDTIGLGGAAALAIRIGQWPLLAAVTVVGLGVIYRVALHRRSPSARRLTPGAVIATALWLAGSGLFAFFVQRFGDFGATYGAIAGVIVLMMWLWLSSLVMLLGATINAELERRPGADTTTGDRHTIGERGAEPADATPGGCRLEEH